MKIYLVCSTSKSWMNTGYGHGLLAGEADRLLVSFSEFSKYPGQQVAVTTMAASYVPSEPASKVQQRELRNAFDPLLTEHMEELFDEGES